jgi:hypothetical protein
MMMAMMAKTDSQPLNNITAQQHNALNLWQVTLLVCTK